MSYTEAVVINGPKEGFAIKSVKLGELSETELLVDIEACGICHTDIGIEQGYLPAPYPCIPGHEGGGTVVEVGAKVTRVKPGDKVVLSYTSCQQCGACQAETPGACSKWNDMNFMRYRNASVKDTPAMTLESGEGGAIYGSFFGQSSLSRRSIVSEGSCVVVPSDTDLKLYAPLGCGLQTGAGAVINRLKPEPDSSIAVFGCGAVGMAAVMAAAYLGVKTIIAIDLVTERLELAKTLGATHGFNGRSATLLDEIRGVTKYNAGVIYAVEASGIPAVLKSAYEAVAPFGHLTSCGSPGPGVPAPIAVHENILVAKTYSGTLMGNGNPQTFIPFLIKLNREGKFPIEKLSKQYALKDLGEAVHAMHDGSIIKPIIVMDM